MTSKIRLAALLLTTALITAPGLSSVAYADDGGMKGGQHWEHKDLGLTDAQKLLLHETMHRLHETGKKTHEEMHVLHDRLRAVVEAPVFDKKAFTSLNAEIEAKKERIEKEHAQAFASIADQFTPEQRKHLAHWFMHHPHGIKHHGDYHHGMGDWHEGWHHPGEQSDAGRPQAAPDGDNLPPVTTGQDGQNDTYPPYKQH